jgi:hypothetical protein
VDLLQPTTARVTEDKTREILQKLDIKQPFFERRVKNKNAEKFNIFAL